MPAHHQHNLLFLLLLLTVALFLAPLAQAQQVLGLQHAVKTESNQAKIEIYLSNTSNKPIVPQGNVQLVNQFQTVIWQKKINYQYSISPGQTDKLEFTWEPALNNLGRLTAKVQLDDEFGFPILIENINFMLLPMMAKALGLFALTVMGGGGILKAARWA